MTAPANPASKPSYIGNCLILEEIGSGGMATVYRAVQQPLGRVVAIKALKPTIAIDSQFAQRFAREAHFMASLQHENILHVHDLINEQGSLYIVMEYVEGIDLFDLLERRRVLPVDVAALIALSVARALDYAHFRGIVHRDVKPANVMLSRKGEVKLMDFGIARDDSHLDLTESGTGLGTPSYMSPEQILGDKLDFRSDLFSLGIVLYQMVTGQKPFVEDASHTVMHKIRLDRHVSPRKLNPKVPRQLEQIMARCMEKQPARRYESTQALIDALTEFLAERVQINHCARLVMFLRELSLVGEAEAEATLQAVGARAASRQTHARKLVGGIALSFAGALLCLAVAGPLLQRLQRPAELAQLTSTGLGEPVPIDEHGYVQVVVDPWAEVYADGKLLTVTPTAERLWLTPGHHVLTFVHPSYAQQTREVDIVPGRVQRIEIHLAERREVGTLPP